jgi:hypothetical protein
MSAGEGAMKGAAMGGTFGLLGLGIRSATLKTVGGSRVAAPIFGGFQTLIGLFEGFLEGQFPGGINELLDKLLDKLFSQEMSLDKSVIDRKVCVN